MTSATTQTLWKIAARRIGVEPTVYAANRIAGRAWCYRCRRWLASSSFPADRCRPEGRAGTCRECRRELDAGRRREGVVR